MITEIFKLIDVSRTNNRCTVSTAEIAGQGAIKDTQTEGLYLIYILTSYFELDPAVHNEM